MSFKWTFLKTITIHIKKKWSSLRISTIKANLVEKVLLHILSHSDFSFSITEVLFDKKDQFYYIYFTDDKTDIQRGKGFKASIPQPQDRRIHSISLEVLCPTI